MDGERAPLGLHCPPWPTSCWVQYPLSYFRQVVAPFLPQFARMCSKNFYASMLLVSTAEVTVFATLGVEWRRSNWDFGFQISYIWVCVVFWFLISCSYSIMMHKKTYAPVEMNKTIREIHLRWIKLFEVLFWDEFFSFRDSKTDENNL